jgi:hypothetical protein
MLFFFLEYTGELHIISLIGGNKQINTTRPTPKLVLRLPLRLKQHVILNQTTKEGQLFNWYIIRKRLSQVPN